MNRNQVCDLMDMVFELNSRKTPVMTPVLQNRVAKILGVTAAQVRRMTRVSHGNEEFLPDVLK